MGTTASVLVLLPQGALLGHVGDSRVYRLRGQQLEQLTFDHSLQWELRALKIVAEGSDFAKTVPKNVITRSLGPNANVVVDLEGPFPLEVGDTFLICSDGLSGQIEDREIGSLLSYLPPEEAATVLVDLANLRGGPDNITLVIVKVTGPGLVTTESAAECKPAGRSASAERRQCGGVGRDGRVLAAGLCHSGSRTRPLRRSCWPPPAQRPWWSAWSCISGGWFRRENPPPRFTAWGTPRTSASTCSAGNEFVQSLATTLSELREAAMESGWQVRWNEFEHLCRKADAASQAEDFPAAVQSYAKGISFMMHELRSQQNRKASDSGVDL